MKKRIKKKIKEELRWLKNYMRIFKKSVFSKGEKCFLVGTPNHGNLGDHAIVLGEYKFLEGIHYNKNIIEIPLLFIKKHTKMFKLIIGKSDIFIHGGGFLGSLWPTEDEMSRNVIRFFPKNKILVFPQTIYFYDNEEGKRLRRITEDVYKKHKNLYLFFREKKSYNFANKDTGKSNS